MPTPGIMLAALVVVGLGLGLQKVGHGIKKGSTAVAHTMMHGLHHKPKNTGYCIPPESCGGAPKVAAPKK